jgi:hypothetical protein
MYTAQKCISRSELIRVLKIMLDGISEGVRAFTDEIRIQLLAVEKSLSQNIPAPQCLCVIHLLSLGASAPAGVT